MSAADWWALAVFLFLSWVIFPLAAFLAWCWAVRAHTLYRAMLADLQAGRPAAPAPQLVAALEAEHHHHAAPRQVRPHFRIPRPRIPHPRRDPFPELAVDDDKPWIQVVPDPCVRCSQPICPRCQGCRCHGSLCECTQVAIGPGR